MTKNRRLDYKSRNGYYSKYILLSQHKNICNVVPLVFKIVLQSLNNILRTCLCFQVLDYKRVQGFPIGIGTE